MTTEISMTKANRLFWMGRYAERVYLSLHFFRKHFDKMIDEDSNSYFLFCEKMGITNHYSSDEQFILSYLYNKNNPDSIYSMLEKVNDNAILLREGIMSETLSYIQLCLNYMQTAKEENKTLSELQPITDYILAFWGSIDERILASDVRHIIKFGKFVESADLHIRFKYSFERINDINNRLFETINEDTGMCCNTEKLLAYQNQMTPEKYKETPALIYLNELFTA